MTILRGAILCLGAAILPAQAPQPAFTPSTFSRFVDDDHGGGHFDLAAVTYTKGDVTVTLFGSVHVADRAHYQELQRRFAKLDALLYECVGNPSRLPRPGDKWRDQPDIGPSLQAPLQLALELEAVVQFEVLDYRQDNFVHADFDDAMYRQHRKQCDQELAEIAAFDRDDADRPTTAQIEQAFARGEGHQLLRLWRGRGFAKAERPPRPGMLVVEGRDERCLEVLQQQLGKGKKHLGIYFGFLHLPHLEQRLVGDLGFVRTGQEWLVALDCRAKKDDLETTQRWRAYLAARDLAALVRALPKRDDGPPTVAVLRAGGQVQDGVDPWGHDYLIRALPKAPFLEVRSAGPDGEMDTDDDVLDQGQPSLRSLASLRRISAQRRASEDLVDRLREAFGKDKAPAAARPPADVRPLRARADAMRICAAAEQWRMDTGELRVPTLRELQAAGAGGTPLLVGGDMDPWGHAYRIELQDGAVVVISDGPDGVPDTADDVRN